MGQVGKTGFSSFGWQTTCLREIGEGKGKTFHYVKKPW